LWLIILLNSQTVSPSMLSSTNTKVLPSVSVKVQLWIAYAPIDFPVQPKFLKGLTVCSVEWIFDPPFFQSKLVRGPNSPFNFDFLIAVCQVGHRSMSVNVRQTCSISAFMVMVL